MEIPVKINPQQSTQKVTVSFAPAAAAARVSPTVPVASANPLTFLMDAFNRLKEAEELRQQGKLEPAQRICEELLREHPDYWGALHTLGLVFMDQQENEQALNHLVRAAMLDPRSWSTLTGLGAIYLALGAYETAAQTLEQARAINPQDPTTLTALGETYFQQREYELASEVFGQALALDKDSDRAALGLGRVYCEMGRDSEAAAAFEGLIGRGNTSYEAVVPLASLPPSLVKVDVLALLDKVVRDPSHDQVSFDIGMAFARVAALDHAGRHAEAWEQALKANRAMFKGYGQEWWQHERDRENAVLTRMRMKPPSMGPGNDDSRYPISLFILGPSRSGKTTMEQLIGTIDGAKLGYENRSAQIAVHRAFQRGGLITNDYFELLPEQLHSLCRETYLAELAKRAPSAKVLTNTHPARLSDGPWLAAVFPNLRFICIKRNVDDVVLRMFLFKYAAGHYYAYDLQAAREHVVWYYQMMDLLADVLPDRVRLIRYEDMVTDPAAAVRTAAELCGLPVPTGHLPAIGDDRGCAAPYRELMAAEIANSI